jgi:hypothetical protein
VGTTESRVHARPCQPAAVQTARDPSQDSPLSLCRAQISPCGGRNVALVTYEHSPKLGLASQFGVYMCMGRTLPRSLNGTPLCRT